MKGIYKITNLINGKIYIGQSKDLDRRRFEYLKYNYDFNRHLKFAMKKYGIDNFTFEPIESGDFTRDELNILETKYISIYESYDQSKGYNLTKGGGQGNGRKWTEEQKRIASEARKGVIFSKETLQRMSESAKKKIFTEEHKKNIGLGLKGRIKSETERKNISKAQKGKNTWIEGMIWWNDGVIEKLSKTQPGEAFSNGRLSRPRKSERKPPVHPKDNPILSTSVLVSKSFDFSQLKKSQKIEFICEVCGKRTNRRYYNFKPRTRILLCQKCLLGQTRTSIDKRCAK
jgi:group I intron endonuclease